MSNSCDEKMTYQVSTQSHPTVLHTKAKNGVANKGIRPQCENSGISSVTFLSVVSMRSWRCLWEDCQFLDMVTQSARLVDGHYSIALPLRNKELKMPNNRKGAEQRALKFVKNPTLPLNGTSHIMGFTPEEENAQSGF